MFWQSLHFKVQHFHLSVAIWAFFAILFSHKKLRSRPLSGIMTFFGFCHQWFYNRPLNSHNFTVCHTVSLSFSWSHCRFFISHGCTNFKGIFSETYYFLRKQTRQHNPLSKNIVALSSTYKKISNSVIFDSETSTWSSHGNECPLNYQKF